MSLLTDTSGRPTMQPGDPCPIARRGPASAVGGGTRMAEDNKTWRDDEALIVGLDETAIWAVRGLKAVVLARALSLRDALILAAEFGGDGHAIVALTQPNDRVMVFPAQIERLRETARGN